MVRGSLSRLLFFYRSMADPYAKPLVQKDHFERAVWCYTSPFFAKSFCHCITGFVTGGITAAPGNSNDNFCSVDRGLRRGGGISPIRNISKFCKRGFDHIAKTQEGTVKAIRLFYTVILTFSNTTVIVPNSKLSNEIIFNLSREGKEG